MVAVLVVPVASHQSRRAWAMNSGPLSDRMNGFSPRISTHLRRADHNYSDIEESEVRTMQATLVAAQTCR